MGRKERTWEAQALKVLQVAATEQIEERSSFAIIEARSAEGRRISKLGTSTGVGVELLPVFAMAFSGSRFQFCCYFSIPHDYYTDFRRDADIRWDSEQI